ncbi:hypothetical protein ACFX12_005905 [Malus domestica]
MQKMTHEWFSQTGSGVDDSQKPSSSSLLADWNSYAVSQSTDESSSLGLGFDLESVVRSANDTVSGTFSVAAELYELQDLWGVLSEVLKEWDHQQDEPEMLAWHLDLVKGAQPVKGLIFQ